ncbi:SUMF1/EgtB/PvdO family nonheme iron enzyme [Cerasicoccus fimbriatus]|uniref:SUMF1/EgtB/PvdO family nonheme iron enzyme n=1 Tax=Cerasicoccus fimbriatus TaxID=3014554 RepID=UPI0022B2D40C|nr:SUMF1/EgtB/PvdO family nonheme iron enzyme [Cerasicoccus sp. TK19100]
MSDESTAPKMTAPPGRAYEVLTPGEKFGDYQVLRCVSYDLLGSLYRVRKPRSKDEKTVFVMPPIIKSDQEFHERFAQMGPKLCKLEHPNVFSFEEAVVVKDRFTFMGKEFDGENLADYLQNYVNKQIKERKSNQDEPRELVSDLPMGLPADDVTSILSQTLEGLAYLADKKIQHYNLNPTNILRAKNGSIKVAGFGLLSLIGQERFEAVVSAGIPPIALGGRAIRINTVDILSPEVRQGKPADARSDVYALGITAYWLLTGRKPTADYVPPSEVVHGLSEKWDIFIANCLDREPEKRYQSVNKAKDDFENFENIRPLRNKSQKASIGTTDTKTVFRHLDFIPVPKKLQEKGTKTASAFRLAVVGVVLLIFGSLIFSAINVMLDDSFPDGVVAIKTPDGQEPRLSFALEPDNVGVKISGTTHNFIVRDGKLDLNILPGSYRFAFTAPGFDSHSELIQIDKEPLQKTIKLRPALVDAVFVSEPSVTLTAVDASGKEFPLGETDASGQLVANQVIVAGDYTMIADKAGYSPTKSGPYTLSSREANTVQVPIEAILGVLRVKSDPSGADVFYGDRQLGKTNVTLQDLPVNEEFLLTVKLDGYRDKTLAVTVLPQTKDILDFGTLTPLSGEIAPVILFGGKEPTPEQLKSVKITGVSRNSQLGEQTFSADASSIANGQFRIQGVREGEVEMTVSHPDYYDVSKTFSLGNNVRVKVPYDMEPLPAILTLAPKPANEDWVITLDGKKVKLPEMQAPLKPGVKHTLSIGSKDYFAQSKSFTPKPNEKMSWAPEMVLIPSPESGQNYEVPFIDMSLVWIAPGSFSMGSPPTEPSRLPEEGPVTQVRLTRGYWIGAHEVTQQQYTDVIGFNPSRLQGKTRPVEYVSWNEAMAYCRKLNEREQEAGRLPAGYEYRLPTEAEWEYAARAGSTAPFHWGNTATAENAHFQGTYPRDFESSDVDAEDDYGAKEVGQYQPNAWGLYDVHGNVREWCFDDYNARLPGDEVTDWVRLQDGSRHPVRGGGWEDFAIRSRAASRSEGLSENFRNASTGFRVVLAPAIAE